MSKVVLASASPRRQELLRRIIPDFLVDPADLDEDALTLEDPFETAKSLALAKARHVAKRHPGALVIGSDTVVALSEGIPSAKTFLQLAKPTDEADAFRILSLLRGKTHLVITGVAVVRDDHEQADTAQAEVEFHDVSDESLWDYIRTGEPMDKAGAYGAQGMGAFLVKELRGEFETVVGLPMQLMSKLLKLHQEV